MIRVKDVRKSFGEKTVLKDINMNFEPGKCNMLIGASGSGKTVLMNIISGLVEPDSGEVWYGDREMTRMNREEKKMLHQKIGMLFQGSALFDFRTVLGNVMFPMDFLTDWSKAEKEERARYLLDKVNVKDSETGQTAWVNTSSSRTRESYARWQAGLDEKEQALLKRYNISYVDVSTQGDYVKSLMGLFR